MVCQCRNVRFEERAREFILLAKVNRLGEPKGNQQVRSVSMGRRIKSARSQQDKTRSRAIYAWAG